MKNFRVKIRGVTPLLQHKMDEDALFALLGAKSSRKKDKEELTPRQIAEKAVYRDTDGNCVVPTAHLIGAVKSVASEYKQKNSTRKTMKGIVSGVIMPVREFETLKSKGEVLKDYEVDIRKATNHTKGAIAVCRPRFDSWEFETELQVDSELISGDTVHAMLNDAGKRSGIGSFRVSKGGMFGQFLVEEFREI